MKNLPAMRETLVQSLGRKILWIKVERLVTGLSYCIITDVETYWFIIRVVVVEKEKSG